MNLFKAGIIPSIPLGIIVGWLLFKSFGVFATTAGILGGAVVGLFLGWLYGFVIILLMAAFTISWKLLRKLPAPMAITDKEHDCLVKISSWAIMVGITIAGIMGLNYSWVHGLIAVFIAAVIAAFIAVVGTQVYLRNEQ